MHFFGCHPRRQGDLAEIEADAISNQGHSAQRLHMPFLLSIQKNPGSALTHIRNLLLKRQLFPARTLSGTNN